MLGLDLNLYKITISHTDIQTCLALQTLNFLKVIVMGFDPTK